MKQLLIGIFTIATTYLYAQEIESSLSPLAEPFSDNLEAVTARSMGVAGAFGAVGADFSNATSNPAGVAFFRKKELGLNLGYNRQQAESTYLGEQVDNTESVLRLNNIAFVYSNLQTEWIDDSLVVKREGLVSWAVTLGMNQRSELNEDIIYGGLNPNNSLGTSYVQTASEFAFNDLNNLDAFERQALNTGILDVTNVNGVNQFSSIIQNGGLQQTGRLVRTGARRDYYLAGGANISNKLYVGATLTVPTINYEERVIFEEEDTQNNYANFSNLRTVDTREYTSVGGALNVGAIYRFNDYFRAGLNVKSPTVVDVDERTTISTEASGVDSDDFEDNYVLRLPWEAGLQLVGSHPKYGLISLEADYVDYAATRLNTVLFESEVEDDAFKNDIQNQYRGAFNFRGGLEFRLLKNMRLRGGYAYESSPFQSEFEMGADYSRQTLGLGLGYRFTQSNITVDLGYNRITDEEATEPYPLDFQSNIAGIDQVSNQFRLGISKRFNQ